MLSISSLAHPPVTDPSRPLPSLVGTEVAMWRSSEDGGERLSPQPVLRFEPVSRSSRVVIQVDDTVRYQSVLGLGSSLEHSTCYNLSLLPVEQRERVLESLVHPERGIGMNLMRLCIGTSDFAPGPFYTYNDMPAGQEDPRLEGFSIERDREYVLPVLQMAQRLNPELRWVASPWTPPPWMKTNGRYGGGSLRPECYPYYAEYLVRFIEAYRREGIEIHALTVQNEPEFGPEAYPSCRWTAEQQRDFIRDHLGPLFEARGIRTLIWVFDHNFNNPGFPLIDHQGKPNVSGFHECDPTIIVLNRDTLQTEYRSDYFIYGQFMKFIRRGAVRVESSGGARRKFGHAAFHHPDGSLVLVVANAGAREARFLVRSRDGQFASALPARTVATYTWKSGGPTGK
jgi:O-glycosyl hydrolase